MKRSFKNISKLLLVTGCASVFAYSVASAAPLVYDVNPYSTASSVPAASNNNNYSPAIRQDYSSPNKIKLQGDVSFNDNGQKINLSLRDTDVQQVLRMFADKAGLNIVFHDSARGRVTLDLVDVSLSDAFNMVMKMSGLTYVIKDNTLMVVSTKNAETLNLTKDNVNILPVKYADAAYIAQFLNTNVFSLNASGLSYGPIVSTNAETNELLIFGSDSDYMMAKKIVDKFDKKPLMTTYRVNHTTPFEMAKMICETLFQLPDTRSAGKAGGSELSAEFKMGAAPATAKEGSLGGGAIACTVKSGIKTSNLTSYQARPTLTLYVQPELGTLTLVGGSEQQIQMINDFIVDNDRKQPQAYLEVSIISLTEEGSKEFQNIWAFNGGKGFNVSFTPEKGMGSNIYWKGPSNGTAGRSITQEISYLVQNHKARILSNPKIVITNGKKSTIDLTQDYVESTTVQVLTGQTGTTNTIQRTYEIGEDNGIKVELLPFISPDGYVSLTIKPEYASVLGNVTDTYVDESGIRTPYTAATLLQRRNLDLTNVRIKDEETLLLGGMIQEENNVRTAKVPLLGDIPLLGFFFRSTTNSTSKTELLFMITPRIIKDTEDVAEL